nr:MAG TPA: hypothetical protein [Caudoviricetes sp.]
MRTPATHVEGHRSHGMNPIDCHQGRDGNSQWDLLFRRETSCPQ